jgi:hypothetical protein
MLTHDTDVTVSWLNTTRVAAPVFPLAVWMIVRTDRPPAATPARAATAAVPVGVPCA